MEMRTLFFVIDPPHRSTIGLNHIIKGDLIRSSLNYEWTKTPAANAHAAYLQLQVGMSQVKLYQCCDEKCARFFCGDDFLLLFRVHFYVWHREGDWMGPVSVVDDFGG